MSISKVIAVKVDKINNNLNKMVNVTCRIIWILSNVSQNGCFVRHIGLFIFHDIYTESRKYCCFDF